MNTKNYVNEEWQCKTWQKAQWYGWWITQNKNIAKQGGCIIDANMTKDILPQILWKMKMKRINCCKNEQATNIRSKANQRHLQKLKTKWKIKMM
jgi:phosphopantothenoylcysteine synthetase/decarboxylase